MLKSKALAKFGRTSRYQQILISQFATCAKPSFLGYESEKLFNFATNYLLVGKTFHRICITQSLNRIKMRDINSKEAKNVFIMLLAK